jgi:hypothetical protein
MAWPKRIAPIVLLGAALLASAALLLALEHNLTFFQDTWAFLLRRRAFSADAFLEPHNEHIVVIPVAIEKLLIGVFGMSSAGPEQVAMTLTLLATALLLFVYVRRRIGSWPALFATALLLFLGPAWLVLLWPFEIGFVGSVLFGIATLLALERGDRDGDLAACLFLAISIGFSSLGVAFVAGAAVDVFQRRRSRGLGRAYVAAVPLLLYAVWWLGWGHTAESHLSLTNVLASPPYVLEGFASSLDSLFGVSTITVEGTGEPHWGRPILVALLVLIGLRLARGGRLSSRLWPVAAAAGAYWVLAAFNYFPGREAHSSRYMYAGAAFILLLAADLLEGVRFGRTALAVGGVVTVTAIASNLVPLREGKRALEGQSVLTRSDLAAIEIARRTVSPKFALTAEIAGTRSLAGIRADEYLPAIDEYGSPAYTPAELIRAPAVGRRQADVVLSRALPVSTTTYTGTDSRAGGRCVAAAGSTGAPPEVRVDPGVTGIEVAPGPPAAFTMRRFATGEYPVVTEGAPGDSTTFLHIPRDSVAQRWYLHVEAAQEVKVCRTAGV